MVFTRAWADPETAPADGDNISAGAGEIRNLSDDTRERINTVLTDNTLPAPPATIANLDTRFATNVDPLRIRGDRVDLRGYTWRRYRITHAVASFSVVAGAYTALTPDMTLTITPVSSASLLEFHFQCMYSFDATSAVTTRGGLVRIRNTTAGTDVFTGGGMDNASLGAPFTSWLHISDSVTGVSGANTFQVQALKVNAADILVLPTGVTALGEAPWVFYCIEHV